MVDQRWHSPSFRLAACQAGYAFEAGKGYFVNTSCNCPTDNGGTCKHCHEHNEFSSVSCDMCGSPLAGERNLAVLIQPKGAGSDVDYDVCPDCVYYIEYGQLDDQSMLDIEDEQKEETK